MNRLDRDYLAMWNVPFAVAGAAAVGYWLAQVFEYGEGMADLSRCERLELVVFTVLWGRLIGQGRRRGVTTLRVSRDLLAWLGLVAGAAFGGCRVFGAELSAAGLAVMLLLAALVAERLRIYEGKRG
ncbi:hypothetical protein KL86APRO_30316 [uncultured Alphaproteobacteria bacterium]|uniref:Transmembrane protein n=1 Tax=uncultured Alphaproteobacteria bacterium TaxID=91750 RepID=A0A212KML4_9PROT|nr:hypothetical protein KL86APRO_30316 [uncultured Alphaproteobacteria bacterium]